MNGKEIKEKRKELGLTQKALAELAGVSYQTINGYENGKEIPTTKNQIFERIFDTNSSNLIKEPFEKYQKTTGHDLKINQIEERIREHEKIIKLSVDNKDIIEHNKEMIKLLKTQIEIILIAKKDFLSDRE